MNLEIMPQDEMGYPNKIIKNHAKTSNQIGMNNKLTKEEKNKFVQEFIADLFRKLENKPEITEDIEEKIIVIDRFEGDLAVCENRNTRRDNKYRKNKIT